MPVGDKNVKTYYVSLSISFLFGDIDNLITLEEHELKISISYDISGNIILIYMYAWCIGVRILLVYRIKLIAVSKIYLKKKKNMYDYSHIMIISDIHYAAKSL